ncbi:CoA-transferase family III protein [Bordetella bronchiseptica 345]|nr:CoA-transferase family III protein [Bordetella bronchiseptica 345]
MSISSHRLLEGIRVLDMTVALAGPYASMLLGGLGAEVIRVEAPGGSDLGRSNPPFVGPGGVNFGQQGSDDVSLTLLNRARNKKSITLNVKDPEGRALFARLLRESDVFIENLSEGASERLGVDYARVREINDRIIYASIKAFGEPSKYQNLKGMDILVQALSGLMAVTGEASGPPMRCGVPVADLLAPLYMVNGILAALIYRGRTGKGQKIQVSMLDCLSSWVAEEHFDVLAQAGFRMRTGNNHERLVPFGTYECVDGHIAIAAVHPDWFASLLDAMGRADLKRDPRFADRGTRMRHAADLAALVSAWTRDKTVAFVEQALVQERGVPAARVRTPLEMLDDPDLHRSGAITDLRTPDGGTVRGMGLPIGFSECHAQFDVPAQALGQANASVYADILGLSDAEIRRLEEKGVI